MVVDHIENELMAVKNTVIKNIIRLEDHLEEIYQSSQNLNKLDDVNNFY